MKQKKNLKFSKVTVVYPGERGFEFTLLNKGDEQLLEEVFGKWNAGSGMECIEFLNSKMRSLSVNDFVKIDDQWYQCTFVGWKKVTPNFVLDIILAVQSHPEFNQYGGWFALNKVMQEKGISPIQ